MEVGLHTFTADFHSRASLKSRAQIAQLIWFRSGVQCSFACKVLKHSDFSVTGRHMTNSRDLARLIIVDELGAKNIFRRNNSFQCRLNDLAWRRRDYAKVESRRQILAKHASEGVQVLFEPDAFADFAQVLSAHGSKLRIVAKQVS